MAAQRIFRITGLFIPGRRSGARQLFDRFLARLHKEKAVALVGLADKITQRPLGIARIIAAKGRLDAIIDELLQRLAEQACAEDEKLVAYELFIDQQPMRTVSGRTAIAAPLLWITSKDIASHSI